MPHQVTRALGGPCSANDCRNLFDGVGNLEMTSTKARILIVDDSSFARRRLTVIFENAGHEVIGTAKDANQAMAMYKELRPDLVTLDYLMTGKSGEQVLKEIIRHDPAAKVIMISGSSDTAIELRTLAAGAKGFIHKFNGQETLLQAVDQLMKT